MSDLDMRDLVAQVFRLLADHCTRANGGRSRFVARVSEIVESSTLRPRTVDELWMQLWPKPFYAGTRVDKAAEAIRLAQQHGVFAEPDLLRSPDWAVELGARRKLLRLGRVPERLLADRKLIGPCRAGFRLATVVELAQTVEQFAETYAAVLDDVSRVGSTDFPSVRLRMAPLQTLLTKVNGISETTAKHVLTDLGFPIPKTDIWICRVMSFRPEVKRRILDRWGVDLSREAPRALERRLARFADEVVLGSDLFVSEYCGQPEELGVDLNTSYRRYRFVDLILSKFGMKPELGFGLERSGLHALIQNPALRTEFPAAAAIALGLVPA